MRDLGRRDQLKIEEKRNLQDEYKKDSRKQTCTLQRELPVQIRAGQETLASQADDIDRVPDVT